MSTAEIATDIVAIPIDDVLIPAERAEVRDEAGVGPLVESIKEVGLLHPIVVRLSAVSGEPILVAGRTRIEAFKELGFTHIPAVVRELDELHAELAEIGENLHRTPLKGHARDAALARWHELYTSLHPPRPMPCTEADPAGPEPDEAPRFDEHASSVTGLAPRTVRTSVRRGKAFDDSDREVFEERGLPPSAVDPIAAIPDPVQRKAAVAAVAEGASPEAAVETVVGPPAELVDDEMSDGEWLDTLPLAGQVADPEMFKAEALLYRRMTPTRQEYAKDGGPHLKAKGKAHGGRVHWLLTRPMALKHPRHWLLCGGCGGKGCSDCRDHGYKVD